MTLGQKIKQAREEKGLAQPKLAELCGWESQSRISQYETDNREPQLNDLRKIAKALGRDISWFVKNEQKTVDQGPMREKGIKQFPPGYATVEPGPPIYARVPLISWVQAGNWSEIVDNFQPGDTEEWCPTTARVGPRAFALRVHGDSMTNPHGTPTIPAGSIVIVDPDVQPDNGKIVVVRLEGSNEATIKKLVIEGPHRYLKPLNPAYPIIEIDSNCTICGVARKYEGDL